MEKADAEPRGMSATGTYAITGLLFVIVVAAAAFGWSHVEIVTEGGPERGLDPRLDMARLLANCPRGRVGKACF
jgi:hypothetical protein